MRLTKEEMDEAIEFLFVLTVDVVGSLHGESFKIATGGSSSAEHENASRPSLETGERPQDVASKKVEMQAVQDKQSDSGRLLHPQCAQVHWRNDEDHVGSEDNPRTEGGPATPDEPADSASHVESSAIYGSPQRLARVSSGNLLQICTVLTKPSSNYRLDSTGETTRYAFL